MNLVILQSKGEKESDTIVLGKSYVNVKKQITNPFWSPGFLTLVSNISSCKVRITARTFSLTICLLEWYYTWNKNALKRSVFFNSMFLCQICGILIKCPEKSLDCTVKNEEFFHSGHMRGVHRNACLTYLFIASNSFVVWAERHKDISKHKPRPAKSWVVRLISKRRQSSTEAKDPILVITLPPPRFPPRDSRRSCCVRLFEHQFLGARVLVTSQCLSPRWLCTNRPVSGVMATR